MHKYYKGTAFVLTLLELESLAFCVAFEQSLMSFLIPSKMLLIVTEKIQKNKNGKKNYYGGFVATIGIRVNVVHRDCS